MAPNLHSGEYRIFSLEEHIGPAGVNHTRPGFQNVYLGAPVTTWAVTQDGPETFRFHVGGYRYTGVEDDKVIASINPEQGVEWIATYREHQDAYTISPANHKHHGWTATGAHSGYVIEIKLIKELLVFPPRFLTSQLFRFERIYE